MKTRLNFSQVAVWYRAAERWGTMEDGFELMPGEVINLKLERVGVFYGSTCGLEPQVPSVRGDHVSGSQTERRVASPSTERQCAAHVYRSV